MRKMKRTNSKTTLNVVEHIILKNGWEYYITDQCFEDDKDLAFALVMGYETEMGDVYMPDLKGHILSRTVDLSDLAPAIGWEWIA